MWAGSLENFVLFLEDRWLFREVSQEKLENAQFFLGLLREFAVFEDKSSRSSLAKKLLGILAEHFPSKIQKRGNLAYEAFKILVFLGIFSEDQNLLLEKFHLSVEFSSQEKSSAQGLEESQFLTEGRRDLRTLFTFTIDGEQTLDFDDAISFEEEADHYVVYVHIADVAHYIPKNSALDQAARKRRKTFYLVDDILPLFPEILSFQLFPLCGEKDSLAVTTKIVWDKDFHLQHFEIFESWIRVDKNYSYAEVDDFLIKKPNRHLYFLPKLLELCKSLQNSRIEGGGGIDILLPHISPYLQKGRIFLKTYDPQEKSTFIIRELMILNNFLSGYYAQQQEKPFLYLCQKAPREECKISNRYITNRLEFSQLWGSLQRSYFSAKSAGHFALGLSYYTQVTSPIRRYIDIVVQRQLKAIIKGEECPYTPEELEEEGNFFEEGKSLSSQLEGERQKYYLLKLHATKEYREEVMVGVIIKILSATECLVELYKTQVVCKVKYDFPIAIHREVDIQLHSIYPRLGVALGRIV